MNEPTNLHRQFWDACAFLYPRYKVLMPEVEYESSHTQSWYVPLSVSFNYDEEWNYENVMKLIPDLKHVLLFIFPTYAPTCVSMHRYLFCFGMSTKEPSVVLSNFVLYKDSSPMKMRERIILDYDGFTPCQINEISDSVKVAINRPVFKPVVASVDEIRRLNYSERKTINVMDVSHG